MSPAPGLDVRLRHEFPGFDLDISLSLDGDVGVLFGPSGAGKSVTLRLIAGLIEPQAGHVRLDGRVLSARGEEPVWVPPQKRLIGYVFQHHALFPHMTVIENIVYGAPALPKGTAHSEARELIRKFRLQGLESSYPKSISGGQKQRVAFARALIAGPKLLLLDEPFSALDNPTRVHMRDCLTEVVRSLGVPVLLVTHDLAEAAALGRTMFVCIGGRIQQSGDPRKVIEHPASEAVRRLVGTGLS